MILGSLDLSDRWTFVWYKLKRAVLPGRKSPFQGLIGDNLTALKTHVSTKLLFKGFETLKYVYDHYGPGCGTKQLKRQFDIMEEKQKDNETVEEFATRLQDLWKCRNETPLSIALRINIRPRHRSAESVKYSLKTKL